MLAALVQGGETFADRSLATAKDLSLLAAPHALLASGVGPWAALIVAIAALLAVDLAVVRGRGGHMSLRLAAVASVCWVAVSLVFCAVRLPLVAVIVKLPGSADG